MSIAKPTSQNQEYEPCPYSICDGSGWYEHCLAPDSCDQLKCQCLEDTEADLAFESARDNGDI